MALTRAKYIVHLNTPEGIVEHEVEVTHGDQLRGELEANKQGLPPINQAPMNHSTVWVWCALTRMGLYAAPYQPFKLTDLAGLEPVRDASGESAQEPVDPTRPAADTGPA